MVMKLTKTDFITLHVAAIIVIKLSIVIEKYLHCKKKTCPRSPTFDKPNMYTNQSSQIVPTPHGSPLAGALLGSGISVVERRAGVSIVAAVSRREKLWPLSARDMTDRAARGRGESIT